MLGKHSDLGGGEHPYLDHVGRDSFYGFLASHRRESFHDEDFADLYCSDNGRPSVPPSLLATALLLQAYEGISDEEARARVGFDLRWKVALGMGLEERPFAKSTLQLFRARLILHERALELVEQAEANADFVVEEVVGDCAYGEDGDTRRTFAEAGRRLVAKVATRRGGAQFPKEGFRIDLEAMSCVCPADRKTQKVVSISSGDRYGAPGAPLRAFRFGAAVCDACPLRSSCVRARLGKGRLGL